ncbi:Cytochrome B [Sphingomonas aurantiaca]|jgi:cytochrome b561|uniref:Cytochrome B n=1 Tax=Sphingomonas aurantiaca TaxID=185949 RepID=A0A5E7YEE9_9SPHN|nr:MULTISPECIES: cytochrome b [Sphingomonas]KQN15863.1 cytochrome B [Sphingomonas sp. Leaf28]VVT05354.1 Cytochrome B [Sphingomonas aurantiaca]
MAAQDRPDRYSSVAIWFHWTIALLIILNLAVGLLHDSIPALRSWMGAHKALGLAILALTVARIAWRLAHRPPPLPLRTPMWERVLAHGSHTLLYVLMLALPVTGWLMVSGGKPGGTDWFGLFAVPNLPVSKATGHFGHEAHELLGWVMLALVVLHIAAALRHHLLLRDPVLTRIAPVLDRR